MGIFRRGDHFYAKYQFAGQRIRVSLAKWTGEEVKSNKQALDAFEDVKAAVRTGTFDPRGRGVTVKDRAISFAQLTEQYFEKYAKPKLARPEGFPSRVKLAIEEFGPLPIDQITTPLIEDWQIKLAQPRDIHGVMRSNCDHQQGHR